LRRRQTSPEKRLRLARDAALFFCVEAEASIARRVVTNHADQAAPPLDIAKGNAW
jgi:hypothetical protein